MDKFLFQLDQHVTIECSGESGSVVGRAQYLNDTNQYLVMYSNGQGVAVRAWWDEEALVN